MSETKNKTCTRCHKTKPLAGFYRMNEAPDGRKPICKDCEKETARLKKAEQAEYSKKYFTF